MTRISFAAVLIAFAVLVASRPEAAGCGGATRPGERVDVADETALIAWDAGTKTQHFVRRATVLSTGYDFGFLVPTPSRPELAEASDDLFTELAAITAPKVEYHTVFENPVGCGGGGTTSPDRDRDRVGRSGGVVVLEQKRVGDLDAAVLAFRPGAMDDPAAGAADLAAWLARNGYMFTPGLTAWVEPYVRDGWMITAFKIAATPPNPADTKDRPGAKKPAINLGARPVRMSFKADRPFFPYHEPEDQRDEQAKAVPRLLRVFVAAQGRVAGKLGDGAQAWPGKTVWAGPVEPAKWGGLFERAKLPAPPATDGWWLTEFEDRSSPRPGTADVFFDPSADTSPIYRRPTVVDHMPAWLGVLCCGSPFALFALGIVGVRWLVRVRPK